METMGTFSDSPSSALGNIFEESDDQILLYDIRNETNLQGIPDLSANSDRQNIDDTVTEWGPEDFILAKVPESRKAGVQKKKYDETYEVLRGEPIHLRLPKGRFKDKDYLELRLQHQDLRYKERPIVACHKHNLYEGQDLQKTNYPLKVLAHPEHDIVFYKDKLNTLNIKGLANKEHLTLQFACCGRESHNLGDSSEARVWILQINGTCRSIPFEHQLKLQVYSTLRQRCDKRLKRKLEPQPIKQECLAECDEEVEVIKRKLQAKMERVMKWQLANLPVEVLKYLLLEPERNIHF